MIQDTGISDGDIEIDGIQFYTEDLKGEQSQSTRDMVTTTVMNGTSVTTQGEYIPMKWSFTTHLSILGESFDYWNDLILELEGKPCTVVCPFIGVNFNALVRVTRSVVNEKFIKCEFSLTEVPDTTDYYIDNNLYSGERLSIYEARVVQEKESTTTESETEEIAE